VFCRDVQKVLNKSGCMNKCVVHYSVMRHDHTDNAPQTAQAVGLPGTAFIKAVTMLLDGKPALCVLCSHQDVDLQRLQQLCGASTVEPATDPELRAWFPSIQVGFLWCRIQCGVAICSL
jgi:prolyl-tRNA editing enzyme YbaK/EbsC (Cys-tRNA(Pro) deacylase)